MAALALNVVPSLRHALPRSLFASTLLPAFLTPSWSIPSLQSLAELFPPFLLAVPKSKISHSRKSMRSANKGLKDKQNIVNCPGCGSPKLAHHLCPNCYNFLSRMWKSKKRQDGGGDIPDLS
ncbi:putative 54S ribosomal protein L32, mitochondrial [Hypsizygus marmoreus]|uniref:Large ribosomal subunit protein bL32m n=1 Tax=Hypsizygus marmoreus TaxID=39966 RepID=A0A369KAJ5_HYPMA|nr:putative 54S ribosomal protein L32, mitochondrial [Hypsizygus marmoreus]